MVNISISTIFTSHRKPNVGPRPVVDGSKNSNKNSRREAPSMKPFNPNNCSYLGSLKKRFFFKGGKSSVRGGNQSTNGKVVIRSVPVVTSVTKKINTTSSNEGKNHTVRKSKYKLNGLLHFLRWRWARKRT